jgi:hypothetical protein
MNATRASWVRYLLIALLGEKVIQHIFVTLAFWRNWRGIGSTVAVDPRALMVLGAILAVLFALCLWAMVTRLRWACGLAIALALCDIVGEFVAQGTVMIAVNVSFTVATALLILALFYRGKEGRDPSLRPG